MAIANLTRPGARTLSAPSTATASFASRIPNAPVTPSRQAKPSTSTPSTGTTAVNRSPSRDNSTRHDLEDDDDDRKGKRQKTSVVEEVRGFVRLNAWLRDL